MTVQEEMSDGGLVDSTFPLNALIPKAETGVVRFLQKYPDFDGRDVTIAIFDSGVDPRAAGLENLCDGKSVKVIERFDCTGCGDVDMSKKVIANDKGFITGLSGRQLKLTPQMIANNTAKGEYRLGLKTFFDICPAKVREHQLSANKIKKWDGPHKTAIADITRKINEFESKYNDSKSLSWDKKLVKDDLDGTLELLNNYEKTYYDIKTTYDCILYSTENGWQAIVDVTEKGDLENAIHIGEYSKTWEIKNIDDYVSISVNVHDDGNVLEIVGMCSPHGTHVASIASGNHESKDLNGVAPNAKIVSMTIGDGRLGSMETGTGLVRAMMKVMEMCREGRKIDVINMSYGEHSHWSDVGYPESVDKKRRKKQRQHLSRISELINEVVSKYGVVWVVSGGNHGPALFTVGTPPDLPVDCCIGVGAYVSPQMMEAEYAMREKLPANVYTWTSRDPCIDGGHGITVCAPGGAIASVPQFTMTKSQLMNGTSMAAPHVAGAVALLISALKQRDISYTPFSIKRAICATATKLDYVDEFAQGSGLLNVEKAFEHLVEHSGALDNMIRFSVQCGKSSKGIQLRQGVLKKPVEYMVNIKPIFFNHTEAAPKDKLNFNVRLTLVSSQPFVQCGSFLDLNYCSRSVTVKVDPIGLPPGVHTAIIRAFDTDCVQKGSLFEIPVTVVQPHVIDCDTARLYEPYAVQRSNDGFEFQPGTIKRDFILVPSRATWAVLRMRSTDKISNKDVGKFFVHTVQLLPKSSCVEMEMMKLVIVNSEVESTLAFKCQENNILELCIAKYWSNFGSVHLKYSLEFHGIQPTAPNSYVMHAACGIHKMQIQTLHHEELQPQLHLKTAAVVLKPNDAKITPLSAKRDVIPDSRQIYQNVLTYTLNVAKSAEISVYAPIFNPVLYESEFESQLWMIFDSNKAMIACGDANSDKFFTKLEKGEYTIRLQIRHETRESLEKINEANMVAVYKLMGSLNLDIYDEYNECVIGGQKASNAVVVHDIPKVFYVAPLTQEKLTKANLPANCAWLGGSITWAKDHLGKRTDVREFMYILNPGEGASKRNGTANCGSGGGISNVTTTGSAGISKAKGPTTNIAATASPPAVASNAGDGSSTSTISNSANTASEVNKNAETDEYAEGLRDFQCSMLTKLDYEKAEKIYNEIIAAHPKHLIAHLLLIQNLEASLTSSTSSAESKTVQYPLTFAKSLKDKTTRNNNSTTNSNLTKDAASTAGAGGGGGGSSGNGSNTSTNSSTDTTTTTITDDKQKDGDKDNNQKLRNTTTTIVRLADHVIKGTDKDALLAFYGLKCDTRSDAAKIKSNMDKQKNDLLEALSKKGIAIAKLATLENNIKEHLEDLDNIYMEIIKFVDANDAKVIQYSLWHAYVHGHYGRMYKYLKKLFDDKRCREHFEELNLIVGAMKYQHLETVVQRMTVSAFPPSYRLF